MSVSLTTLTYMVVWARRRGAAGPTLALKARGTLLSWRPLPISKFVNTRRTRESETKWVPAVVRRLVWRWRGNRRKWSRKWERFPILPPTNFKKSSTRSLNSNYSWTPVSILFEAHSKTKLESCIRILWSKLWPICSQRMLLNLSLSLSLCACVAHSTTRVFAESRASPCHSGTGQASEGGVSELIDGAQGHPCLHIQVWQGHW